MNIFMQPGELLERYSDPQSSHIQIMVINTRSQTLNWVVFWFLSSQSTGSGFVIDRRIHPHFMKTKNSIRLPK